MGNKKKNKPTNQVVILRNGGGKKKKKNRSLRGITQNVGVSVGMPFGDNPSRATLASGLNAFDACSVPLPRAIGDYTVIRTTQVISGTEVLSLFGPVAYTATAVAGTGTNYMGPCWSNVCRMASVNPATAVYAADNTKLNAFSAMNGADWSYAKMVPAAFSVQIMNPEALQTTTGIAYIGRARQMLSVSNQAKTWNDIANELVSYSNPRLCSAGKLALKGVQTDCVPFDMNAMSDFRTRHIATNGSTFTSVNNGVKFDAMAPIFVYNPEGIELQYLVCCEWRVRFDPSNPAYATSSYHPSSSERYWDRLQEFASYMGNGVGEIADAAQRINAAIPYGPNLAHAAPAMAAYAHRRFFGRRNALEY